MNAAVQSDLFCRHAGALAILHSQPTVENRLKPWVTFGRPYRDFGIRALPSLTMTSTTASSGRERTEQTTQGACADPTVNTFLYLARHLFNGSDPGRCFGS